MRRILSLLMSIILVMGVCVCFSSCDKEGSGSSSDETSNPSGNAVFTDEYFKDAMRITMTLCAGDYDGEKMDTVISVLKQVPLEAVDPSLFLWSKTSRKTWQDPNHPIYGMPFEFHTYYADGSHSDFVFNNGFVYFESDLTEEAYMVPTSDLCKRIMDALGIKGID